MRTQIVRAGWMVPLLSGLAAACGERTITIPAPSQGEAPKYSIKQLEEPNTCKDCHQSHFTEWSASMHAYSSIDPVFRAMNARGQKETGGALGDFCVKCHAPMALALGMTTDGLNLDSIDEPFQGVTCYFCHNTQDVTGEHNNPLVLANDAVMRGPVKSPLEFGHKGEYSEWFDDDVKTAGFKSSELCGSCHDIVVPAHFSGATADVPLEQTFQEWRSSVFAVPENQDAGAGRHNNAMPLNCTSGAGCHMQRETNVPIASPLMAHPTMPTRTYRHQHDFPAVDTALVDFPDTEPKKQGEKIQEKFSTAFRVALCADIPMKTSRYAINVQLENLSAGHFFPSGASQDRRIWIELHAYKGGAETFKSGAVDPGVAATTVDGAWILYDKAYKGDGSIAHMFWDVAKLDASQIIPVSRPDIAGTDANRLSKEFQNVYYPDRVTMTIWVEAIGLDLIDDILGSGNYLDPSIRDKVQRFAVQFPTPQPPPTPDGKPVTFEWTVDTALAALDDEKSTRINGQQCVEFPPPVNISTMP